MLMRSSGSRWPRQFWHCFYGTLEKGDELAQQLNSGGRLQIGIIALVFFGPIIFATWMYATGQLRPVGSTNHGSLLDPVINLAESLPESSRMLGATDAAWKLLYVSEAGCDVPCHEALVRMRQIRLMLGNDMDRLGRIFLHDESLPDKVNLLEQHRGLITISDKGLGNLLEENRPKDLPPGGIYLVDPLDNLIMYFSPAIIPGDMADDLKHLLELSRIG